MADTENKEESTGVEKKKKSPQQTIKREKQKWTMERCMRAAKRFANIMEWEHGAPSSFKAATDKGWVAQCSTHMKAMPVKKTVPAKTKKSA